MCVSKVHKMSSPHEVCHLEQNQRPEATSINICIILFMYIVYVALHDLVNCLTLLYLTYYI